MRAPPPALGSGASAPRVGPIPRGLRTPECLHLYAARDDAAAGLQGERNLYQYNFRAEVPPVKEAEFAPRANKFQVPSVTMEANPERRMALVSGDRVRGRRLRQQRPRLTGDFLRLPQSVRRHQEHPIHPDLEAKPQWNTTTHLSHGERRGAVRVPALPRR